MDSQKEIEHLKTDYAVTTTDFDIQFGKPIRLHRNARRSFKQKSQQINLSDVIPASLEKQNRLTINNKFPRFIYQESTPNFDKSRHFFPRIKKETPQVKVQNRIERLKSQRNTQQNASLMIGSYKIGGEIGKGSYGSVRIAKSWKGNIYAIKIYEKQIFKDKLRYKNIQNQIQVLSSISHPNLLVYIQTVKNSQNISIVTELVDNTSLIQWMKLKHKKTVNKQQVKKIIKSILEGLKHLHSKNFAHRDLKMENILINKDKNIKIIDFGFSVRDNILHKDFCGTPHYISPEIISKGGYMARPADIWAVGVIMFKLCTGEFPFKGITNKALFRKICNGSYQYTCDVDDNTKRIISKLLSMDPSQRPVAHQLILNPYFSQV